MFQVHAGGVDYAIIAVYFAVVLGIGFVARLRPLRAEDLQAADTDRPRGGMTNQASSR